MKKAISIRTALGLSVALGLMMAMPAWAKGKAGSGNNGGGGGSPTPCTTTNVTSILNDSDANALPFQIQSDGLSPYTTFTSHKPKDSVKSEIASNCFWTVDTTASTTRSIGLTLAYNLGASAPSDLAGPYPLYVHGRLVTHCTANSSNNGLDVGTMTAVGQTATCPINMGFYAPDGAWYNLAMNPNNWDGTTQMQVTCSAASGGLCNEWTIVPDPATAVTNLSTGQASAIGELVVPPCVACGGGTPVGLFEVSFNFLVHR